MKKNLYLFFGFVVVSLLAIGMIKFGFFLPSGGVAEILKGGNPKILPLVVLISALVDSLNPCAISVLLITIAFLFNLGHNRRRILEIGGIYIFGIFVTYILIGLGIIGTLQILNIPNFMVRVGAGIVILWGLINLINVLYPKFPIKLKIPRAAHGQIAVLMGKSSRVAALGLGALVGVTEFPCTGGPYLFVLLLLHGQATQTAGLLYLIGYNLVFILPLVIILLIGSDRVLLEKVQAWKRTDSKVFGLVGNIIMVLLGLLIFAFS